MSNPAKFDRCVKAVKKRGGAANAYAVCQKSVGNKKRKRNPAAESVERYEEFHGRKPDEIVDVTTKVHFHKHLAGAGRLEYLIVDGVDGAEHKIQGFKGALLAFNEKKDQLFIEGGDQSIDLNEFDITRPHERETLGSVKRIGYFAHKDHLGREGGAAVYDHKFSKPWPDLIYSRIERLMLFSGGNYKILAEGIDQ